MSRRLIFWLCTVAAIFAAGCGDVWNDPYPAAEQHKKILYESFNARPKHFDPAQSYAEDEAWFVYSTYETLYEYHYLKRPYTLVPNLAESMPTVSYRDADGNALPEDADPKRIAESIYEIRLRPGVLYQPHPAFAKDEQGRYRYTDLDDAKLGKREQITDFEYTGTREMTSEDFAYQIKRLIRPGLLESPGLSVLSTIVGLPELGKQLDADVAAGKIDPNGWIDLRKYPLRGVETPDPHLLRIHIKGKYPQFIYWFAMTFIVPLPWEAERFYGQPGMAKRELTLDMWPVGTGPFMLTRNKPLREIVLEKNPNFREQTYPCEGEAGDQEAGLLRDCGKRLPLIDGVRFAYEREAIPFWNKFLQGYYDFYASSRFAGMANFDTALQLQGGALSMTEEMEARGVALTTETEASVQYFFFNMLDPLYGDGGATPEARERARKLRRAVAIALDIEEYLTIVKNGLGIGMQGPVAPGLPGYKSGDAGLNHYLYRWHDGRPQRRSLDEARKLLAEAGYPDGRDAKTGEPLVLYFDGYDSFNRSRLELLTKQLKRINIQLVPRLTEWNRFQEKNLKGTFQFTFWGWNADYPDPENFLFQYYGPNSRAKADGANYTNYSNPEFDRLYEQFRDLDITADRQGLIDKMTELEQRDTPVAAGWHDQSFILTHAWVKNVKLAKLIRTNRKYIAIDPELRAASRAEWNRPARWPFAVLALLLAALAGLAWRHYRRHETAAALDGGAR